MQHATPLSAAKGSIWLARCLALASLMTPLAGCNSGPGGEASGRPLSLAEHGGDVAPAAASLATTRPTADLAVSRDAMRNDVYFLSSDRLEGRGLGGSGLDVAGDYVASRFAALGLKPLPGLDGYSQPFEVTTVESAKPETRLVLGDKTWALVDKQVMPSPITADKAFEGGVVFAGYGIVSGQRNYDDFAKVDVKGKVVLAMRYEPHDPATGKSRWAEAGWTNASGLESKAAAASQRGAVALLMVNPPNGHALDDDRLPPITAQMVRPGNIPVLYIKRDVAAELLKAGGLPTLKDLQDRIDAETRPASRALADTVVVKGEAALKRTKKQARNVVAMIPGQGPAAGEYVVIGAHYDHLGWGGPGSLMTPPLLQRIPGVTEPTNGNGKPNPHAPPAGPATKESPKDGNPHAAPATNPHAVPGSLRNLGRDDANPHAAAPNPHAAAATNPSLRAIHHGADDNASGTAAMLELARIYSHRPAPPRTLVFVAFTAEEEGLIGSAHFVNHPPIDLKKIVTMVNLDMVGRVRKNLLYVGGHGTAPGLEALVKKADAASPLEFKNLGKGGLGPSDHMSFATKKVPVLFLFTGTHADYHKPSDTADKVNYEGMAEVVKFGQSIIDDLEHQPIEAYVDAADRESMSPSLSAESSGRRVILGVVPSYAGEEDGKGVKIDGTTAGTPADKAGLKQGDVLLKLGKNSTTTLQELTAAISACKPGETVELVYARDGKQVTTKVTLVERK